MNRKHSPLVELSKFRNEFIKKNEPNNEFLYYSKELVDKLSRLLQTEENEAKTRQFVSELSDHLEIQFDNSELVDRLEVLEPLKIVDLSSNTKKSARGVDQGEESSTKRIKYNSSEEGSSEQKNKSRSPAYYAKTDQFKDIVRVKTSDSNKEPLLKVATKIVAEPSFYCSSWSERLRAKIANSLIEGIIENPKEWIEKMQTEYEDLVEEDNPDNYDFSKLTLTAEELAHMYRDLEPGNFMHDKVDGFRLKAKVKQNWVAIALLLTVKKDHKGLIAQRRVFNDLRYLAKKEPYPPNFAKTSNLLWRHCKAIHRYHEMLGDFVILSYELFDKMFFLEYPAEHIQTLIDTLKESLPDEILKFKRFK